VEVTAGDSDWDEPTDQVHRAINVGRTTYEEVTIFFLDRPDACQPIASELPAHGFGAPARTIGSCCQTAKRRIASIFFDMFEERSVGFAPSIGIA
jgi:hypothetical protein